MELTSKNIAELKTIAHSRKNLLRFNIGKTEVDNNVFDMLDKAITKHEIIKICFLKCIINQIDLKETIIYIANRLNAAVVQIIGHTAILYRQNLKLENHIILKR